MWTNYINEVTLLLLITRETWIPALGAGILVLRVIFTVFMIVTYIVTCNGGKAAHLNCQQKSLPYCQRLIVKGCVCKDCDCDIQSLDFIKANRSHSEYIFIWGIFRFHLFQWQQIHVVELHGTLIAACIKHFTSEACISDSIPSPCLTKDSPLVTDNLRCQHLDHISLLSVCFKNGPRFYLPAAKIASGNGMSIKPEGIFHFHTSLL